MELAIMLDSPVRTLFERIALSTASETPDLGAIGVALVEFAGDRDYLTVWIARLGTASGPLPIHAPERGPRLMLVHRREGEMSPIHDHGTWVAVTPIAGLETHRRYRVDGHGGAARPEIVEELSMRAQDVATLLPPDDLHAHGHLLGRDIPAHFLILTGDDQFRYTRREWDLATGRHRILRPGERGRWLETEPMPAA
jgi:hypothetical protein